MSDTPIGSFTFLVGALLCGPALVVLRVTHYQDLSCLEPFLAPWVLSVWGQTGYIYFDAPKTPEKKVRDWAEYQQSKGSGTLIVLKCPRDIWSQPIFFGWHMWWCTIICHQKLECLPPHIFRNNHFDQMALVTMWVPMLTQSVSISVPVPLQLRELHVVTFIQVSLLA